MNEIEIRKTFEVLKKQNELIEVRVVSGKATFSGYFRSIDNLIAKLKPFNNVSTANIYFVLNPINEACYDRQQCEQFVQNPKSTTSDGDVSVRDWVLIDIDPVRSTGVSSSDEEKENAKKVAYSVYKYLKNIGFSQPVCCDSGNGWHFLYKIQMKNDDDSKELIKNFLIALDMMFSNENATVDTSVFNASRITKLYGTTARKGNDAKKRPHRESKILRVPENIGITKKILFQKVVDTIPKKEQPTYKNNYGNEKFDIDGFLSRNRISVNKIVQYGSGVKYILDECVFDCNHKAPDACIFVMRNGAIGYKCFHNSCQNYTWQDVRKKFEPDAYEKKARDFTSQRQIKPTGTTIQDLTSKREEEKTDGKPYKQLSEIISLDRSQIISVPSGFSNLDKRIIGFNKGEVSVWSGKNGSAKSTVINQICLNACNLGFKCGIFSGELTNQRQKQWLQVQCAGRQNVMPTKYENLYFVPKETGGKIDKWLDGKLWLYDNDFGNKFEVLLEYTKKFIEKNNIDVLVLDNLMALDILTLNGDKYQQQTTLILALVDLAKTYNIHLHIVCHPRKAVGFLRKDDISGTADLTNAVHNVFIVHRVNQDFMRLAKEFYGEQTASEYYGYGNVIECCKNRDLGIQDELFGYYFEIPSKRFLVEPQDNVCYGWESSPTMLYHIECDELPFGEDGDLPY